MYTAFAVSLVVSESILKIDHQKQCSIFRSISGFANRVLRRYLQYARVPPASLRPRFNIMNSLAAHGNAGSHYVIGQYKRGCSGYTHKYLLSRISYLVSLELTALVTLYDSSLSPQGTRDELLGGVTFPLRSRHLNVISLWGYTMLKGTTYRHILLPPTVDWSVKNLEAQSLKLTLVPCK